MFNRIKEKKGGFTLVELIIVLVILAILAAFLVPTLTGYVDRANEKALIAETRLAVMAAQTLGDEVYAAGKTPEFGDGKTVLATDVKTLAEVDGTIESVTYNDKAKVTALTYKSGGKSCNYKYDTTSGGTYEVPTSESGAGAGGGEG